MSDSICKWSSTSCTDSVERHRVQVGDGPLTEVELCSFHGQYWPRVGEDQAEYLRRTQRVRAQLATPKRRKAEAVRQAESRKRSHQRHQSQIDVEQSTRGEDDVPT